MKFNKALKNEIKRLEKDVNEAFYEGDDLKDAWANGMLHSLTEIKNVLKKYKIMKNIEGEINE